MTLVAALTPTGLQAAMTLSGAVNGDVFAAYLDQVLGPTLRPGDVVVLDNLPAHKVAGLAERVEALSIGRYTSISKVIRAGLRPWIGKMPRWKR